MQYTAIIEKADNGYYVAQCAELPAAITQGTSIEDVKENLKDAIELLLIDAKEPPVLWCKSATCTRSNQ
jgi:predicted RNase H-like HicB family nuclease